MVSFESRTCLQKLFLMHANKLLKLDKYFYDLKEKKCWEMKKFGVLRRNEVFLNRYRNFDLFFSINLFSFYIFDFQKKRF